MVCTKAEEEFVGERKVDCTTDKVTSGIEGVGVISTELDEESDGETEKEFRGIVVDNGLNSGLGVTRTEVGKESDEGREKGSIVEVDGMLVVDDESISSSLTEELGAKVEVMMGGLGVTSAEADKESDGEIE